jgi:hypothetical protein
MATKFQVTITEVETRTFGYEGRSTGTVVRLAGHWTIEGREVVRFGQTYREICDKCQGTGYLHYHQGVEGGRCFPCNAAGFLGTFGTGTAIELGRKLRNRAQAAERREAAREAKFAALRDQMAADLAAWRAANAELLPAVALYSAFIICEHPADCNGPCYRDACEDRRDEAKKIYTPALLILAYEATYKALTAAETAQFVELIALQERRDAARAAKAAATAEKVWLGTEGQKISVTGVLSAARQFEGQWGSTTLYKVTTAEGNTVTWFRSGWFNFEGGETITLTGTIKALKETEAYGKETQLTRCKIS